MNKKLITTLISSILVSSMLMTGCSGGSKETSKETANAKTEAQAEKSNDTKEASKEEEQEVLEITVGNWPKENDESGQKRMNQVKEDFEKEYPNIKIKPDTWAYDVNSFLPKAAAGQLPTLYNTFFTEANKIVNGGYAKDITDLVKSNGMYEHLNKEMLALVTKDDKIYGLPTNGYAVGIEYNAKLFEEAGVELPKTFDEIVTVAKTIQEKTGVKGFFFPTKNNQGGWMFTNTAWNFGVDFITLQDDGKYKATFNTPEAVEALKWVRDLKWEHNLLPDNNLVNYDDFFKYLGTGQVAMGYGTPDFINQPVMDYGMSKDDIGLGAMPTGPKDRAVLMGGSLYMIAPNATEAEAEAVLKFLEFQGHTPNYNEEAKANFEKAIMADAEAGRVVIPGSLSAWESGEIINFQKEIYEKHGNVDKAHFESYLTEGLKDLHPEVPVFTQELYAILDTVIQEVLTNENADLQGLLDKANADFQSQYLDKQ